MRELSRTDAWSEDLRIPACVGCRVKGAGCRTQGVRLSVISVVCCCELDTGRVVHERMRMLIVD